MAIEIRLKTIGIGWGWLVGLWRGKLARMSGPAGENLGQPCQCQASAISYNSIAACMLAQFSLRTCDGFPLFPLFQGDQGLHPTNLLLSMQACQSTHLWMADWQLPSRWSCGACGRRTNGMAAFHGLACCRRGERVGTFSCNNASACNKRWQWVCQPQGMHDVQTSPHASPLSFSPFMLAL